ncbi:hypothetical protein HZB88_02790 [archaeon]|nr:hypothetical protein [archaeon]
MAKRIKFGNNGKDEGKKCWLLHQAAIAVVVMTLGFAFLVQGFIYQVAVGKLYYGLLHYLIAFIFFALACWFKKNYCCK